MGSIAPAKPVKLIAGFIFKEEEYLSKAESILESKFGKIDFKSRIIPFNFTNYYAQEFGDKLNRVFVSFLNPFNPAKLSFVKSVTNAIEKKLSLNGSRLINIDPGYLDSARLVLASTKDFAHRIYLDKGIFAEITLVYRGHSFRGLDWTYPDYRSEEYIKIFNEIRERFISTCRSTLHT